MDKKQKFNETLSSLIELAASNSNKLDVKQIEKAFEGILEDSDMLEHVYEYLVENKITLTGYISPLSLEKEDESEANIEIESNENFSPEENSEKILQMYLSEINNYEPITVAEEEELISLAMNNDKNAKDALTTHSLSIVVNIASSYKDCGIHVSDLIQEGNIGLLEGIETYSGNAHVEEFHNYIKDNIKNAIEAAIDENVSSDRIGRHLADRANALDNFSTSFAKKNGREPSVEELAKGLSISTDEVYNIIKYSLDALNSNGEE